MRLLAGLLSVRYFLLRASTATAAVVSGLVQTFVFARVLSAQEFSIYILIGTFGVSLWLFDLGAAKILFVRQRARHLAQRSDNMIATQSSAVVVLYALIVLAGTLACFAVMASRPSVSAWQGFRICIVLQLCRAQSGLVPAAQRQQRSRRIHPLRDARSDPALAATSS